MKTKTLPLLFISLLLSLYGIAQKPLTEKQKAEAVKTQYNEAAVIFEGYYLKTNPSFLVPGTRVIHTMKNFKVLRIIKGTMPADSIIQIEVDGGGCRSGNRYGKG
jgi:hypothetical protein